MAQLCERPGNGIPHSIVLCQVLDGDGHNPRLDRRTGGKTFDTRTVKRASAAPFFTRSLRHSDVTELAMQEAARRKAVGDQADPNSGSDGNISKVTHIPAAPQRSSARAAPLTSVSNRTGTLNFCVRRDAMSVLLHPAFVVVRIWPQVGRVRVQVDRAEAGDPERVKSSSFLPASQDRFDCCQRCLR